MLAIFPIPIVKAWSRVARRTGIRDSRSMSTGGVARGHECDFECNGGTWSRCHIRLSSGGRSGQIGRHQFVDELGDSCAFRGMGSKINLCFDGLDAVRDRHGALTDVEEGMIIFGV